MKAICFGLLIISFFWLKGNSAVDLVEDLPEYKLLGEHLEMLEDPKNEIKAEELLAHPERFRFHTPNESEVFSRDATTTYWLRFTIKGGSAPQSKWVLEILDSRFDEVVLYSPTNGHGWSESRTGLRYPVSRREYEHKNFVFDLNLSEPQKVHVFYLKIEPGVVGSFLFKIRQNKVFSSYGFKEYLLLGMYYGILLIMAFYNLFLYTTIRENVYVYYFFYVLAWAFNSCTFDGLGFQFIWQHVPALSKIALYGSNFLILFFYILYSINFLELKKYSANSVNYMKWLLAGYVVITVLTTNTEFHFLANHYFAASFVCLFYIGWKVYRKGYKPARYYVVSNGVIVAGLFIHAVKTAALFNYLLSDSPGVLTFMVYIRNVSMVLDIVILSIALGDRIRYLKKTAEEAQSAIIRQLEENKTLNEKVNRELEEKVQERTRIIEEQKSQLLLANQQLQSQAEEITQMNILLDKDNWNLKKNIIEEKEARISLKEINYPEFSQVYPNDSACYLFLEEIKWGGDFQCRKCGCKKHGKGATTFARRCSNCRYDESLTAYTIFHRCKFDIRIALYIAVMVNRYGDQIVVSDLAKEVNIRVATCWKFVQKLLEVRSKKKYHRTNDGEKLKYLIMEGESLVEKQLVKTELQQG